MAQIKSQKKRIITNEKARKANSAYKSSMRTAIKKVRVAVENKDTANVQSLLNNAISLIDKSVSKGVQKENTAIRQKVSLCKLVDTLKA